MFGEVYASIGGVGGAGGGYVERRTREDRLGRASDARGSAELDGERGTVV